MIVNKYFLKIHVHTHYTFLTGYWATWYISGTQHPKVVEHAPSCSSKVAPRNSSLFLWHNLPAHSTYVTAYLCSIVWPCLTNCTSDYENCVGFDCRRLAKVFSFCTKNFFPQGIFDTNTFKKKLTAFGNQALECPDNMCTYKIHTHTHTHPHIYMNMCVSVYIHTHTHTRIYEYRKINFN